MVFSVWYNIGTSNRNYTEWSKKMIDLNKYLQQYFEEVTPYEFYRAVFPCGELAKAGQQEQGKYTAIAVELTQKKKKNGAPVIKRYTITDDLKKIDELLKKTNFIIISPISYAGKNRNSENARYIYALAIDLDGITKQGHISDLLHQMEKVDFLPMPTYIISSGTGLHLYYLFKNPIPCFKNITKQLAVLKKALTEKIWNKYTTSLYQNVQIESLFQGFRLVGGVSKTGSRTKAYETGKKIDIEYLNGFVLEQYRVKEMTYKSNLTRKQAKEKFPEWYEKRIVQKKPRGTWTCKRDLYDWWKRQIMSGAKTGHRYFCIMCLAVYAKKSGISREELEKDSFELLEFMESLTNEENNHFTQSDILEALEMYNDNYFTFPIDSITQLTDIPIQKNKRNGRKQQVHLQILNATNRIVLENGGSLNNGRPNKQLAVRMWQANHPKATKAECIRATGISKPTVYKYWINENSN